MEQNNLVDTWDTILSHRTKGVHISSVVPDQKALHSPSAFQNHWLPPSSSPNLSNQRTKHTPNARVRFDKFIITRASVSVKHDAKLAYRNEKCKLDAFAD